MDPLLEQVNGHLERNGTIVPPGSINIIDATVIEARQSRQRTGKDGNNTQDSEAAYNVKMSADGQRKTTDGCKMHVNTNEDGIVRKMTYTPGNVHDSKEMDGLLDISKAKSCGKVHADSAYANKKNDARLGRQDNKIPHRAHRNRPLTKAQKKSQQATFRRSPYSSSITAWARQDILAWRGTGPGHN